MLRGALAVTVGGIVAGAAYLALPPRVRPHAPTAAAVQALRGAIHVHTRLSDGTGEVEEIAAAAARAGLDFVILTDHGDATRAPAPPAYRDGILCIDAVEVSTDEGHVVALGLAQAPYPLGGEARDVIEDIARLGGFAIAAHPGSSKPQLRWNRWDLPIDGVEWLNGDSEWRDEARWTLARALFTYPFRGTETLASLLDRPEDVLRHWDAITQQRRVVAIAAADAHARIGLRSLGEPYDNTASLHIPSYERMFRLFSNVIPGVARTGDAEADAATVLAAIRQGHLYSVVDGIAPSGGLTFNGASGTARAAAGDSLPATGPVRFSAQVDGPADARIDLFKDGRVLTTAIGTLLQQQVEGAGVYRIEVSLPGAPGRPPVPWIVSNPIYVRSSAAAALAPAIRPQPSRFVGLYTNGSADGWTIERSPEALAALDVVPSAVGGTELALRYALGGAPSASPFAAFVMPAGSEIAGSDRLLFTARADRPMRLSVQLRRPGGEAGERWHRSVFLDSTRRDITVYFDDLTPRGATASRLPSLAEVQSVLFVIDTVNTPLGGSGRFWIDDVKYAASSGSRF
jgi:hypothetical protein